MTDGPAVFVQVRAYVSVCVCDECVLAEVCQFDCVLPVPSLFFVMGYVSAPVWRNST